MDKLYKLFRMKDDSILEDLDKRMSAITGKSGIITELEEENEWRVSKTLERFNINREAPSGIVYNALLAHLKKSEEYLYGFLGNSRAKELNNFDEFIKKGYELMKPKKLWVVKKEKFREILEENEPRNTLKAFGYKNAKELFLKERLEEVASSLRFMESNEWMHNIFEKAYSKLKPEDFEERDVEVAVLSGRLLEEGKKFVKKKHHNLSHLKELGVIFIIPIDIKEPGELIRAFALYLHYLYEVQFYSDLFRAIKADLNFSKKLISLLRGDILEEAPVYRDEKSANWLIVQRYLAKNNESDKRLFMPHVNPEAVHWKRAEEVLTKMDGIKIVLDLGLWMDLDWVGAYFTDGKNDLISFDLIDIIMSLVDKKFTVKYLYHQQEALWNRLFEKYIGEDKLEAIIKKNLLKGYIELPNDL